MSVPQFYVIGVTTLKIIPSNSKLLRVDFKDNYFLITPF
jgi:hypothetical protein